MMSNGQGVISRPVMTSLRPSVVLHEEGDGDEGHHLRAEGTDRGHDRQPEQRNAQQVDRQQRLRFRELPPHEENPGDGRNQDFDQASWPALATGQVHQPEHAHAEGEGAQKGARQVEADGGAVAERHGPAGDGKADDADRHVDGEKPFPMRDRQDGGGDGGRNGRGPGHHEGVDGKPLAKLGARIGEADDARRSRSSHRPRRSPG